MDRPSHAGRTLTGRSIGRQLGSRRIRQAALGLVNTGRFSLGPGTGVELEFCDTRAISPKQRS
jgi:hypothetical protein